VGSPPRAGLDDYLSDEGGNRPALSDIDLVSPRVVYRIKPLKEIKRSHSGLLRRLGLSQNALRQFSDTIQTLPSANYGQVIEQLLGTRNDEFLGFGLFNTPPFDSLGQFPVFEDDAMRRYYDAAAPGSPELSLVVQLPRSITRKQGVPGKQPPYGTELAIPKPDQELLLRASRVPFFPFSFEKGRITSSDAAYNLTTRNTSPRLVRQPVRVVCTDNTRTATAYIQFEVLNTDSFNLVYGPIRVLRLAYYAAVTLFFVRMLTLSHPPDDILRFIQYLEQDWLPLLATRWRSSSLRSTPREKEPSKRTQGK